MVLPLIKRFHYQKLFLSSLVVVLLLTATTVPSPSSVGTQSVFRHGEGTVVVCQEEDGMRQASSRRSF